MMKHETNIKPISIGSVGVAAQTTSTGPLKRGLWRNRSVPETPVYTRSPITKAFDFLPWGRSKKPNDKVQQQQPEESAAKPANCRTAADINKTESISTVLPEKEDAGIHYHRNIFRSGGGLIRDILGGDKLNKEKTNNNQQELALKKSNHRVKPKQVVARNKSLDIHELINTVERELGAEKQKNGRSQFIDDTFIENIMRAKEAYRQRNSNLLDEDDEPDEHRFADEIVDKQQQTQTHEGDEQTHCATVSGYNSVPSRHILFNDEDIVYLIKKELPVKKELSKAKRKLSANHEKEHQQYQQHHHQLSQQQHQAQRARERERDRDRHDRNESIHRTRFKFKKLIPNGSPQPDHRSISAQMLNNNSYHKYSEYNAEEYGHPYLHSNQVPRLPITENYRKSKDNSKRGILQRQNTSPALMSLVGESALPSSAGGGIGDGCNTELRRHQQELRQRDDHHLQPHRRKSLTDCENSQLEKCSSSSSMGSGGGIGIAGNGSEQPRGERPRKKLSFREPIVADKPRIRRRSSPAQRSNEQIYTTTANNTLSAEGNVAASAGVNDANSDKWNANSTSTALMALQDNSCFAAPVVASSSYVDNMCVGHERESQAMRIVRTVGQAFEVCHKFNLHKNSLDHNDERSDVSSELLDVERISEQQLTDDELAKKEQLNAVTDMKQPQRPNHLELVPLTSSNMRSSPSLMMADDDKSPTTPSSPSHEISKLKDQLEQQAIQTRQALAQLMLVREQLISETNARIEAQARTQQLLQQNRELLEHLASLGAYNEQQTAGLTSANIGMAPQLQMLLHSTGNNNNLATINQQINSLGSINQQLTSLSHQLSGLNQQSQNLQNFQNINATHQHQQQQQQPSPPPTAQQQLTPPSSVASLQQSQLQLNIAAAASTSGNSSNNNNNNNVGCNSSSSSTFPSVTQLQSISNQLQHINAQTLQPQQDALSKDLFQVNQELLNRLQALNLGTATSSALTRNNSPLVSAQQTPSPHSSFFFVNPMSCSPSNNNNSASNYNFLRSPSVLSGNLTPSPISTLTRNCYTHSPQLQQQQLQEQHHIAEALQRSTNEPNLNSLLDDQLTGRPTGSAASNGNIAASSASGTHDTSRSSSTLDSPSSPHMRNASNETRFNTVMLRVTDEAGNVTNQRKLSATPSFIQRSTSEKVPNRSQIMSQVQRTAWARHTTK